MNINFQQFDIKISYRLRGIKPRTTTKKINTNQKLKNPKNKTLVTQLKNTSIPYSEINI